MHCTTDGAKDAARRRARTALRSLGRLLIVALMFVAGGTLVRAAPVGGTRAVAAAQAATAPLDVSPFNLAVAQAGLAYTQPLVASGGVAPYSFVVNNGALPAGITLSSGGVLGGVTTSVGSHFFTVAVFDSGGQQISRNYVLIVSSPIAISPPALPPGKMGSVYQQTLDASGGVGPYTFAVTGGALPQGMTLSPGGFLGGTPMQQDFAAFFSVTATDAQGAQGSRDYYWAIDPAVTVAPPTVPGGKVGQAYMQGLSANGGTAPYIFTMTAGELPPGISISTAGLLSGTPTTAGFYAFAVQATDARGLAGQTTYNVSIDGPALTISPTSLPDAKIGVNYRQRLTASGGTAPYTFALTDGELPQGMTFGSDGTLSGKPLVDGVFYFTVTASDARGLTTPVGYALAVSRVTLSISPTNLPNGTAGLAYRQRLTSSGGTGPYTFKVIDGSLPVGLNLSTDGWLRGRPLEGHSGYVTIQVTDGRGNLGTRTYWLVVDQSIQFQPGFLSFGVAGTPYSQLLTASGGTAPYSFALVEGALPPGLTLSAAGLISGVSLDSSTYYGFVVRATDARGLVGNYRYILTMVTPIAISPPTLVHARAGLPYQQPFAASGGTAPYMFTMNGQLPNGLVLTGNGGISGTPTDVGWHFFSVTATDSRGLSATHQYTLVVDPALELAPGTLPAATLGEPYLAQLAAGGGQAPYLYHVTGGALPDGLTLSADGIIQGTPTSRLSESFSVTVTDAQGLIGQTAFYLSIYEPQIDLTPADLPVAQVGQAYQQQLQASGGTAPYIFFSDDPLPDGIRLTPDGRLLGTPLRPGEHHFFVEVLDARGIRASKSYTLVVTPIVIEPGQLPDAIVNTVYSQQFTASGGTGPFIFITNSNLPPGMSLSRSGLLSGTPRQTGWWWLQLLVIDANGYTSSLYIALVVVEPLALPTAGLPDGTTGVAYSAQISANGGQSPYSLTIAEGVLPPGLELSADGTISGTPTLAGAYGFTIGVTDQAGRAMQRQYTIVIN